MNYLDQMTSDTQPGARILGSLRTAGGKGVVRMEDRFDTEIDDVWSALTDPQRLAAWMADVEGDLRAGGEFRARFLASGWEGTGRVEACEPSRRLLLLTRQQGKPDEQFIEVTLAADDDQTILVWEERGMPADLLAAYGAGIQVHVEDLAAHLAGRERCDAEARWAELHPAYQELAAKVELGGMNGEFLDHRVREQLRGQLGDPLLRHRLGELDLEPLALADPGDLAEAEAPAGAGDRLALRVVDLGLQHHVDDESRHIPNSTRACGRRMRVGIRGRLAVALEPRPP